MNDKSNPEIPEMSRTEELTLKLLDKEITDEEMEELIKLFEDDENLENHKLLIEIEAGLRGDRERPEVLEKIMQKIKMMRVDELTLKFLDNQITEEEMGELEKLVEDDENFESHRILIEQDAVLRGMKKLPENFSEQIKQKIRELEKSRGKVKESLSDGEENGN